LVQYRDASVVRVTNQHRITSRAADRRRVKEFSRALTFSAYYESALALCVEVVHANFVDDRKATVRKAHCTDVSLPVVEFQVGIVFQSADANRWRLHH